jgi:hypothetical protein
VRQVNPRPATPSFARGHWVSQQRGRGRCGGSDGRGGHLQR